MSQIFMCSPSSWWDVAECKMGCRLAKYYVWCLNLFTWLITAHSISLHLSDSLHLSPISHCHPLLSYLSIVSLLHCSSSTCITHLSTHLHLSIFFTPCISTFFFPNPLFSIIFHHVESLPISLFLHHPSTHSLHFNHDMSASSSL